MKQQQPHLPLKTQKNIFIIIYYINFLKLNQELL